MPDGIAMHCGDQRHFVGRQRAEEAPDRDIGVAARRRHFVEEIGEVIAAREILALALERDKADVRVVRRSLDRIGEGGIHGDGDRIAPLGTREGQRQDGAAPFNQYMFAHRRVAFESGDLHGPVRYRGANQPQAVGTNR